jgi:hypothetical protein
VTIVVDRTDALIDQPIAIVLRGFKPRQPVSVTATQTYAEVTHWQSRATFISDSNGQVDVTSGAVIGYLRGRGADGPVLVDGSTAERSAAGIT